MHAVLTKLPYRSGGTDEKAGEAATIRITRRQCRSKDSGRDARAEPRLGSNADHCSMFMLWVSRTRCATHPIHVKRDHSGVPQV